MNTNDGFQHQRSHARSIQSLRLGSKCVFCPETEDIPKISQTIQSKMVDREIITDQGWTTYVGLRVFNFTINLTACPKGFEASFEDIERICGWISHRFTCFKNVCISMQIIYCKSTCFCKKLAPVAKRGWCGSRCAPFMVPDGLPGETMAVENPQNLIRLGSPLIGQISLVDGFKHVLFSISYMIICGIYGIYVILPNWRTPSFFRGVGWNHQPV